MSVQLVGYPTNLGLPVPVHRPATAALRAMGITERLRTRCELVDWGDLPLPRGETLPRGEDLVRRVVAEGMAQSEFMSARYRAGDLWVTLGGDHSTSLGAVLALAQAVPGFDIVWVDAHGDFNTPATSPSGNPHGMVLALLAGLTPYQETVIDPRRVHILGARAIDPEEDRLLRDRGVHVWSPDDVRHDPDGVLAAIGAPVYLSFDLDVLDPSVAPAVRTASPGGFTLAEAVTLVQAITARVALVALDLVEYAPDLDADGESGRAAMAVLTAACTGAQVAAAKS